MVDRKVTVNLVAEVEEYIEGMARAAEATNALSAAIRDARAALIEAGAVTPEAAELLVQAAVKAFGIPKGIATVTRLTA